MEGDRSRGFRSRLAAGRPDRRRSHPGMRHEPWREPGPRPGRAGGPQSRGLVGTARPPTADRRGLPAGAGPRRGFGGRGV